MCANGTVVGGGWSCADVVVVRTPRKLGFDAQRADGAARSRGWGWVQIARPGEQGRQHAMVRTLAGRWVWIRGASIGDADADADAERTAVTDRW